MDVVVGTSREANSRTFRTQLVSDGEIILASGEAVADEPAGGRITLQVGSIGPAFWLFTGICLLSLLFGLTIMPETKGRTLEEIAASWRRKGPAPGGAPARPGADPRSTP